MYKLYEYITTQEGTEEAPAEESQETLSLTDEQRRIIEDFATAVDMCDLAAIETFDFEQFPIDIMLLLHWARMDILAAHEYETDRDAVDHYRHSIAAALRGLAHPDEQAIHGVTKHPMVECA
jgi:molybdopterin-guanine dinucleotide biosynthesis protein